ncbi:MAG TPA: CBS domain-containing protein [Candidatus Limnocylindria bacterium]|nr:CBS domain-containing protein [Candidatus Limnocylindria bacterium]
MSAASAPTVGDAMTKGLVTVHASARLYEAAQLMDAHKVHGLPVVDSNGTVVGVLSQTDLLRARVVEHLWTNLRGLAVRHVMTAPAITIPLHATLDEAAELMEQRRVHRLVVIGPDGVTPVGILSVSDLVRVMAAGAETLA